MPMASLDFHCVMWQAASSSDQPHARPWSDIYFFFPQKAVFIWSYHFLGQEQAMALFINHETLEHEAVYHCFLSLKGKCSSPSVLQFWIL